MPKTTVKKSAKPFQTKDYAHAMMPAWASGQMGYRKYQGGTKPRTDPMKYTQIIIQNPKDPKQGRVTSIGKRGGIYGQGGNPKTRWGDLKKITAALPGAALATVAVGAGFKLIADSQMGSEAIAKIPGGRNTLALGLGLGLGYLGYKNRYLMALMAGMGLAAYALVKLGSKEAKLFGTDEADGALPEAPENEGGLPSFSSTAPSDSGPVTSATLQEGISELDFGKKLIKIGSPKEAIPRLNNALRLTGDPAIHFYIATAYEDLGDKLNNAGNKSEAKTAFKVALLSYRTFIDKVAPSALLDEDVLESSKTYAESKIKRIRSHVLFAKEPQQPTEEPAPELIQGHVISGDDLDDDIEGYDEDDDDIEGDDEDDDDD